MVINNRAFSQRKQSTLQRVRNAHKNKLAIEVETKKTRTQVKLAAQLAKKFKKGTL